MPNRKSSKSYTHWTKRRTLKAELRLGEIVRILTQSPRFDCEDRLCREAKHAILEQARLGIKECRGEK